MNDTLSSLLNLQTMHNQFLSISPESVDRFYETTDQITGDRLELVKDFRCGRLDLNDENPIPGRDYMVSGGVLTIPVKGVLLHQFPFQFGEQATGYRYIWDMYARGTQDDDVKEIVLSVDSPGGQASGLLTLLRQMRSIPGRKTTTAQVSGCSASAAYAVSCAADRIVATEDSEVGSIGVIYSHYTTKRMYAHRGVDVEVIKAGEAKDDGHPLVDMTDEARGRIQANIDRMWGQFIEAVASSRGISPEGVREQQARVYDASRAVELGLIDEIVPSYPEIAPGPREAETSAFAETQHMENTMTDTATTEGASAPTQNAQSAVAAERKRFAAVLGSEHFTAYKSLAENLLATDMSAEEVISALNAASEDSASRVAEASQTKEAPASAQAFFDRMQAENADVPAVSGGPISEAQNLTDPEQAAAASLRATFAQFGVAH